MSTIKSLQKGLIFHAPLDGEHLAKDVTPYNNDGTITGATLTTGVKGEAEGSYIFDGSSNDSISYGNSDELNPESITISFWSKRTDDGYSSSVSKDSQYYDTATALNANTFTFWDSGSTNRYNLMLGTATLNKWHHIVATYDLSTTTAKTYRDNVLKDIVTNMASLNVDDSDFTIGSHGVTYDMTGNIADVRIYNRALSTDEIKLLYDKGRY